MDISFDLKPSERVLVHRIAARAVALARQHGTRLDLLDVEMDVTAAHANGCPLRLADLSKADDFNFAHDVFGIRRHLDRTTGELLDCFLPRFAA